MNIKIMDQTYFHIVVYTEQDFSDKEFKRTISQKENMSIKEYTNFISINKRSSSLSEFAIKFIAEYDHGNFIPDKCDAYEPLKEKFDPNDLSQPISWLSTPGGAFYFKKTKGKKFEGVFENLHFTPMWSEGKILHPQIDQPLYMGKLQFILPLETAKMKGLNYWLVFIDKVKEAVKGDFSVFGLLNEINLSNAERHKRTESILSNTVKNLLS